MALLKFLSVFVGAALALFCNFEGSAESVVEKLKNASEKSSVKSNQKCIT